MSLMSWKLILIQIVHIIFNLKKGELLILDELEQIKNIDKSNMLSVVRTFPEQIEEIIRQAKSIDISKLEQFTPSKIMVCGMGGSAISGDILKSWLRDNSNKIINTIRNYNLPLEILILLISFI